MTTPPPPASEDDKLLQELQELAKEIIKQTSLGYTPVTFIKGVVTAVDFDGTPPTISLQVNGDTTTTLSDVRMVNNYSPEVGQTVLIAKMDADLLAIGQITSKNAFSVNSNAGGWRRASISNGSHGANGNGDIYYRRIQDHGSWKMQWRGGWGPGGSTALIEAANALPEEFRPSSSRSVLCARQFGTGATAAHLNFLADGTVLLYGETTAPYVSSASTTPADTGAASPGTASASPGTSSSAPNTDSVDPSDGTDTAEPSTGTGGASAGTAHTHAIATAHSHGVGGSHYHSVNSHAHTVNSHSHTVNSHDHSSAAHKHVTEVWVDPPAWVSLNGVEYFL